MAYRAPIQQEQPPVAISGRWLNEHAHQMGTILTKLTDIDRQQSSTVTRLGDIKSTLETAAAIFDDTEERHKYLTDIENLTRENTELRERLVVVIADLQNGQSRILQAIDHLLEDNTATDVHDILTRISNRQAKLTRALLWATGGATIVAMLAVLFVHIAHKNTIFYQSSLQTCRLSIWKLIGDIIERNTISIDSSWIVKRLSPILG